MVTGTDHDFQASAELLRVLGHSVRLRIAAGLAQECACVKEIWECLGMPQAVVSQHLKVMRDHGILEARRDGARVCYSLTEGMAARVVRVLTVSS
ncbi:MAG: ArsR family transcriptional regulator [Desulfuromonadales bacterium]|nr:MAG: ArsR family transcriptional regulator [Desulfuromonadales bacterium]